MAVIPKNVGQFCKEDRKDNAEQLERLTNSELQKLFIKDKVGSKEQVREKQSHKNHLKNIRNLHEESRGKHGMVSKKNP